jgi:hypothetical protein
VRTESLMSSFPSPWRRHDKERLITDDPEDGAVTARDEAREARLAAVGELVAQVIGADPAVVGTVGEVDGHALRGGVILHRGRSARR